MQVPGATYRVQFNQDFRFKDALRLVDYWQTAGITHLYASPIFMAREGSTHGYDVVNPSRLNPALGTEEDFAELAAALKQRGMSMVLDIVPNHMAASWENPWWTDVLENGSASAYATFFDIHWETTAGSVDKLLLPFLGEPYGQVLEKGELHPGFDANGFYVGIYQAHLPLDPTSYVHILDGPELPAELSPIVERLRLMAPRHEENTEALEDRRRAIPEIKAALYALYASTHNVKAFIDARLQLVAGQPGVIRSFDLLDRILSEQAYTLAFWQIAREKVNYRRFFDISDLVGLRVQDPQVFRATHDLIAKTISDGNVTGLRVDHVDGLNDPQDYLRRLRETWPDSYLVVEKILTGNEKLPSTWPVAGTTGYDFLAQVNGLLTHPSGYEHLKAHYVDMDANAAEYESVVYEQKRKVMKTLFAGETTALGLHLGLLAEGDRHARDFSPRDLRRAMVGVTAAFPVYRTYIRSFEVAPEDAAKIDQAIAAAKKHNPEIMPQVFDFIARVLKMEFPEPLQGEQRKEWLDFVMRWQQLTGPVAAKGVEDTTFYIYNPLAALNEVGGEPQAISLGRFHQLQMERRRDWPATMNATSTHDTKRSEDVRARLLVISELAGDWTRRVSRWHRLGKSYAPDVAMEMLFYQTVAGAWPLQDEDLPLLPERIREYMKKAAREAKQFTSWLKPDEEYEEALLDFVDRMLRASETNHFLPELLKMQPRISFYGAVNSLAMTLLKICCPGVPDFYQGTLSWYLTLVDPDNRRPVDFTKRDQAMAAFAKLDWPKLPGLVSKLLDGWADGNVKSYVIQRALRYRSMHPALFIEGTYEPLLATGRRRDHVVGFMRRHEREALIAVAPRFTTRFSALEKWPLGRRAWGSEVLALPADAAVRWRNVFTGEILSTAGRGGTYLPLSSIFDTFPVALLEPDTAMRGV